MKQEYYDTQDQYNADVWDQCRNPLLAEDRFETIQSRKVRVHPAGYRWMSRNPLLAEDRFETCKVAREGDIALYRSSVAIPY